MPQHSFLCRPVRGEAYIFRLISCYLTEYAPMTKRAIFTAMGLIGTGIIFGVVLMTSFNSNAIEELFAAGTTDLGAKTAPVVVPPAVQAMNDQFASVADAVTKSVVSINVSVESAPRSGGRRSLPDFFRFFEDEQMEAPEMPERDGAGSGVIISADGYIVTNNHVVEGAKEGGIKVMMSDQREYKAKLIGRDPTTDLAVLKVEGGPFQAVHLGEKSSVRVGDFVVAVGNPLGLRSTVTAGIVSAIGRGIGVIEGSRSMQAGSRYAIENFIQTDAAINPGNSGGGLFNLAGSLVGINTAIASMTGGYQGYGFAIPIDMVKSIALDIMDDGKVDRGYIGVQITSVDETAAKTAGLDKVSGVFVNSVVKGGAAESAGIEVGDIILEVDGTSVRTSNDLQNQIVLRRAGDKVTLRMMRAGKSITKTVTLKTLDGDTFADASSEKSGKAGDSEASSNSPVSFKDLGFTAGSLTDEIRKEIETDNGVVVTKIEPRSAVARRGLRQGSVILKVDGRDVNSPGDLKRVLDKKKAGDGVLMVIKTKDGRQAITVEIPEDQS